MNLHSAVRWGLPGTPGDFDRTPAEPLPPLPAEVLALPVLVIEDEAMIGWLLESLLEDMGFASIRIAATAKHAVALAREVTPGLVVSDVNLGPYGDDGIAVVRQIVAIAPVAALFVTAHVDPETRERIADLGLSAPVLAKPVSARALYEAIAEVLTPPRAH